MNHPLPKNHGDFSNVGETGPSLTPSTPKIRAYTLPNPHSFPSLRPILQSPNWAGPVLVVVLALTVFGWNLTAEPPFVDEFAYVSQSFYADLWITGRWDNPAWLTYAGYDLPPLPKYAIGLALRAQGYRRPGPAAMNAWYQNISSESVSKLELVAARWPSVAMGAFGCLAIYGLGVLGGNRRIGWIAALLLMFNPLYAIHARRAMSDVYAESLLLATAACGLWGWQRLLSGKSRLSAWLVVTLGSGVLGGLATLSKLNGVLGLFVLGAWAILALGLIRFPLRGRIDFCLATFLAGIVAFTTFCALNPFLFAHPSASAPQALARLGFWERVKVVSDHRVNVSDHAKSLFPNDALRTGRDKVEAVVVQGFGRFGPFGPRGRTDSTIRFDWKQDRGALLWIPIVGLGFIAGLIRGIGRRKAAEPPTSWAILVQAIVAVGVVTAFIPLAWDRYFLSIQPGFALLGSYAVVAGFDLVRGWLIRRPLPEDRP